MFCSSALDRSNTEASRFLVAAVSICSRVISPPPARADSLSISLSSRFKSSPHRSTRSFALSGVRALPRRAAPLTRSLTISPVVLRGNCTQSPVFSTAAAKAFHLAFFLRSGWTASCQNTVTQLSGGSPAKFSSRSCAAPAAATSKSRITTHFRSAISGSASTASSI